MSFRETVLSPIGAALASANPGTANSSAGTQAPVTDVTSSSNSPTTTSGDAFAAGETELMRTTLVLITACQVTCTGSVLRLVAGSLAPTCITAWRLASE